MRFRNILYKELNGYALFTFSVCVCYVEVVRKQTTVIIYSFV